jgi:hypothetical protein
VENCACNAPRLGQMNIARARASLRHGAATRFGSVGTCRHRCAGAQIFTCLFNPA